MKIFINGINEFSIDGKTEIFNKEEFISELFAFIKTIEVKNRKNSKAVELIKTYLMEKTKKIWDESYGKYGWT